MNTEMVYTQERRGDLKRLNIPLLKTQASDILAGFGDVAGAYLFGSALEFVRPQSDIDIGIVLNGIDSETVLPEIEATFRRFGGHPFHITALDEDAINFTFSVLTKGDLFYIGDYEYVTEFIEQVVRRHEDVAPFLQTYRATRLGRLFA